ncbi:Rpn family recombination-promoting nuclease/putative transposase [Clostridium thermarum]|uniref:Rpn family recombination-promoting nuclease/putative transposase n=1 Tax=Clostridium thermarum TaxID=1716543 RepID=UPI00111E666C|nr:Rpn family recombination-promoting nuclease/putative transposase [Clostridium thermarum]
MAKIDIPIKRLMQSCIEGWINLVVPDCKKEWIKEMDTDKVPAKKESKLDKLILIDAPQGRSIINIEPQGYLDYKLPARMLRYRADIWEYTIEKGIGTPSIEQIVVYFYSNHDNKQYSLKDASHGEETLNYKFKTIKVWEMNKENVIERKLTGLYPLIPLMEKSQTESDERIIQITMATIDTVTDEALHADLLSVMSILAAEKFSSDLIKKYIGRSMLMNSPIYNEWVEEERKEAAKKAALDSAKKYIVDLLAAKFDFVPKLIREGIQSLDDIEVLDELHKKIIKINSLEEFKELLKKAKSVE